MNRVSGVLLDDGDAAFIAGALELLARLLDEQRSQPSARLTALTSKLRRASRHGPTASVASADLAELHQPPVTRAVESPGVHDPACALIGVSAAATRLGITPNGVRDLARRDRITAHRNGGRWSFDAAALDAYADERAARGG